MDQPAAPYLTNWYFGSLGAEPSERGIRGLGLRGPCGTDDSTRSQGEVIDIGRPAERFLERDESVAMESQE